jgi:hypothetical protein
MRFQINKLTRIDAGHAGSAGRLHMPVGEHGANLRGHQQAAHVADAVGVVEQLLVVKVGAAVVDFRLHMCE